MFFIILTRIRLIFQFETLNVFRFLECVRVYPVPQKKLLNFRNVRKLFVQKYKYVLKACHASKLSNDAKI